MSFGILSFGVVCPGGVGSGALDATWQAADIPEVAGSRSHRVCLVDRDAPELRRWEAEPRLRRASPISYYLIEAANQALDQAPGIDRRRVGIVGAFFLGCLVYTVRFYRQLTTEGRRSASPVIFPETVFNSPLSHVVSVLGLGGPVYSQVGDTSCWSGALRTAQAWLRRGTADHVLVVGAEEFEAHQLDAFRAGGLFGRPLLVGEGAGAILLGRQPGRGAALSAVHDGFSFVSKVEATGAARLCIEHVPPHCPILDTASGWMVPIAARAVGNRQTLARTGGPFAEAATASCAWNTILGASLVSAGAEIAVPCWGLSQQCGVAILGRQPAVSQP